MISVLVGHCVSRIIQFQKIYRFAANGNQIGVLIQVQDKMKVSRMKIQSINVNELKSKPSGQWISQA